jgi:L-methionine (R)-S-oxide reductase
LRPTGGAINMPTMDDRVADWLRRFLDRHGGSSGTVHVIQGDALHLAAAVNIPQKVQDVTRVIPRGRGMAGLAWERGKPVSTCNLKEDATGDVRPGAKAVDATAAVAFPVGTPVRAVVGIAWHEERDLDDAAVAVVTADAADLPLPG